MQRRFKKLAKWAIQTCLGIDNASRIKTFYDPIRFRLLYLVNYKSIQKPFDILFFCPGPQFWPGIKPVVEELIHRRRDLRLGLTTWSTNQDFPDSFYVPGVAIINNIQPTLLNLFHTRILYTSLPGLPRHPNARMVHALMSLQSLDGVYEENAFDAYDYILCAGPYHVDSFQERARRRPSLLGKRLLPAGYPRLDHIVASHSAKRRPIARSTVVYAPTHIYKQNEGLTSLRHHGEAIINALLAEGHRVIFRPHPISFLDQDRSVIDRICRLHAGNLNFSLDANRDYTGSYSLADLMVTDTSGTGFSFGLSFSRPCIFFSPNAEAERGLRGIQFEARHRIGAVVRDVDEMISKTSEFCDRNMSDEIERFRDESVFNVGKSATYIVDCLEDVLSGRERPEWVRCGHQN